MARIRNHILRSLGQLAIRCARGRILPATAGFTLAGLVGSALAQETQPMPVCYKPAPPDPGIIQVSAIPNPSLGADTVRVSAIVMDIVNQRPLSGATLQLFQADTYDESWPMKPLDGKFDSDSEGVFFDLDVSGLAPGDYYLYISSLNEEGDPGTPAYLMLRVTEGE